MITPYVLSMVQAHRESRRFLFLPYLFLASYSSSSRIQGQARLESRIPFVRQLLSLLVPLQGSGYIGYIDLDGAVCFSWSSRR